MRFNNEAVRLKRDTDVAQMRANRASDTSGIAFVIMAESGTIDEVTATEHMEIFAAWESSVAYSVGNLRIYNGVLYKCIQAHTSQEGWEPDKTAALWKIAGDPAEEFPEWS